MPSYHKRQGVVIPVAIEPKVEAIGVEYYNGAGRMFTVTSGRRLPSTQASAMYNNLLRNPRDNDKYINRAAADAITSVFNDAQSKGQSRDVAVARLSSLIQSQVDMGNYISKHLIDGAIDVQSSTMTSNERRIFETAARKHAKSVLLETAIPHWHLQF